MDLTAKDRRDRLSFRLKSSVPTPRSASSSALPHQERQTSFLDLSDFLSSAYSTEEGEDDSLKVDVRVEAAEPGPAAATEEGDDLETNDGNYSEYDSSGDDDSDAADTEDEVESSTSSTRKTESERERERGRDKGATASTAPMGTAPTHSRRSSNLTRRGSLEYYKDMEGAQARLIFDNEVNYITSAMDKLALLAQSRSIRLKETKDMHEKKAEEPASGREGQEEEKEKEKEKGAERASHSSHDCSSCDLSASSPVTATGGDDVAAAAPPQEALGEEAKTSLSPSHKEHILNEILTTEENYVQRLLDFKDSYISSLECKDTPMKVQLMERHEMAVLLASIKQIRVLNKAFLEDLQAIADDKTNVDANISKVFLKYIPLFTVYADYAAKHEAASAIIDGHRVKKEFTDWLKECHLHHSTTGKNLQDISSYLIMPVQRIPRYKLLLCELGKHVEGNEDFDNCLRCINDITSQINEYVREKNQRKQLINLRNKFTTEINLVVPGRVLVLEGMLGKVSKRSRMKKYMFHLFNDKLVYSSPTRFGTYIIKQDIDLDCCSVKPLPNMYFEILTKKKSFIVMAPTAGVKEQWISELNKYAVTFNDEFIHEGKYDDSANTHTIDKCYLCSAKFGFFKKRFICHHCGMGVCSSCSNKRSSKQAPSSTSIDGTTVVADMVECSKCNLIAQNAQDMYATVHLQITKLMGTSATTAGKQQKHFDTFIKVKNGDETVGVTSSVSSGDMISTWENAVFRIKVINVDSSDIVFEVHQRPKFSSKSYLAGEVTVSLSTLQNGRIVSASWTPSTAVESSSSLWEKGFRALVKNAPDSNTSYTGTIEYRVMVSIPSAIDATNDPVSVMEKIMNNHVYKYSYISPLGVHFVTHCYGQLMNRFESNEQVLESLQCIQKEFLQSEIVQCLIDDATKITLDKCKTDKWNTTLSGFPRGQIMLDLQASEFKYVSNLKSLLDVYITPLDESLSSSDKENLPAFVAVFFQTVHHLYVLHLKILTTVETVMDEMVKHCEGKAGDETSAIGNALLDYIPLLQFYTEYSANAEKSKEFLLDDAEVSAMLHKFRVDSGLEDSKSFSELISLPLSRIAKYRAFVTGLLTSTPQEHPDHVGLCAAVASLASAKNFVGLSVRESENLEVMMKLQSLISGLDVNLLGQSRSLVKMGTLTKLCRRKPIKYMFFLFTDILIYCKRNMFGDGYQHKKTLIPMDVSSIAEGTIPGYRNAFYVKSAKKSFTLIAPSVDIKNEWLIAMDTVIKTNVSVTIDKTMEKSNAPFWMSDDSSTSCLLCNSSFTFFLRRHHCRACGKLVCAKCSQNKAVINNLEERKSRVCEECVANGKIDILNGKEEKFTMTNVDWSSDTPTVMETPSEPAPSLPPSQDRDMKYRRNSLGGILPGGYLLSSFSERFSARLEEEEERLDTIKESVEDETPRISFKVQDTSQLALSTQSVGDQLPVAAVKKLVPHPPTGPPPAVQIASSASPAPSEVKKVLRPHPPTESPPPMSLATKAKKGPKPPTTPYPGDFEVNKSNVASALNLTKLKLKVTSENTKGAEIKTNNAVSAGSSPALRSPLSPKNERVFFERGGKDTEETSPAMQRMSRSTFDYESHMKEMKSIISKKYVAPPKTPPSQKKTERMKALPVPPVNEEVSMVVGGDENSF